MRKKLIMPMLLLYVFKVETRHNSYVENPTLNPSESNIFNVENAFNVGSYVETNSYVGSKLPTLKPTLDTKSHVGSYVETGCSTLEPYGPTFSM